MGLPTVRPMRRLDLIAFDVTTGLWVSVRHLAAHLGAGRLLRVVLGLIRRAGQDPLRGQPVPDWALEAEPLVRHQLRPALQLDEVLADDLDLDVETRLPILTSVIAEAGAAFVATHARDVTPRAWQVARPRDRQSWAQGLVGRFFNAHIESVDTSEQTIRFEVSHCRFVTLVRALGRPHLAPLFCAADSLYFERPGTPATLTRRGTLALGAPACDFLLTLKAPADT